MSPGTDLDRMMPRYQVLTTSGRLQDALDLVREHIEDHRDDPRVWLVLGQALNNLGEGADAEAAVRQALALEPNSFMGLLNLSRSLLLQGRFADARAAAEELTRWFPEDANAHGWLGSVHNQCGYYREALASAREALRLDPAADHYAVAVEAAANLGRHDEARRMLADGLAADPQNRELLLLSGRISNGAAVVGDQAELLSRMLAASPMDRGPLERLTQEVLGRLRRLTLLPWFQGVAFCFLAPLITDLPAGGGVALALWAALAVVLRAGFGLRRLTRQLPSGFLKDLFAESPDARRGVGALVAAEVWVLAATLGVGFASAGAGGVRWFLVLLVGSALPAFAARYLLHRAAYRAMPGYTRQEAAGYAEARARYGGDRSASAGWLVPVGAVLGLLALPQQTWTTFGGAANAAAGAFILAQVIHYLYVKSAVRRWTRQTAAGESVSGTPTGLPGLARPPVRVLLLAAAMVAVPVILLGVGTWLLATGSVPAG